ncbi:hypothetical protein DQW77_13350 [Roseovarius sp. TE539]|nr:hypothetical protein DQW77_13350 [Roseovarius sp. TE539]
MFVVGAGALPGGSVDGHVRDVFVATRAARQTRGAHSRGKSLYAGNPRVGSTGRPVTGQARRS